MSRSLVILIGSVYLFGCGSDPDPTPPVGEGRAAELRPIMTVKQTMEWILDPAVDVIWDSAGFVITAAGERDLSPATDEGWLRVRNAAAVVAEAGNLLMIPGRSAGPAWDAFADGLIVAGQAAIAAAEVQDAKELFDAGGQIYQVCRACHAQFMIPIEQAISTP